MKDTVLASIERLRVEFPSKNGPVAAVKDVSFDIAPGEIVGIVGESGSGKSVSSSALMQLTNFTGGKVVGGTMTLHRKDGAIVDLRNAKEDQMRRVRGRQIGMIFQEPMTALNPAYTIGWQMAEGLQIHEGLTRQQADERSLELLRLVKIPESARRLKQYPHELSGGMRQRVVIAMALACKPSLLIADEPTTALDVTVQAEILALINTLRDETGAAIMLITHDMAVVAQMADRVIVMYKGGKVEDGPVRNVLSNPQHPYSKALLAAVPKLGDMSGKAHPEPMKIVGSKNQGAEKPIIAGTERLLEVKNLVKRFTIAREGFGRPSAKVHAVENVSLHVNRHETLALVGESGSGKSATGRCILRLDEPDSGTITFDGRDVLGLGKSDIQQLRRNMQMIFQDPFGSLNPKMRLLDQVAEPIRNHRLDSGSAIEDRVANLFDRVELPRSFLRRYPSELSGGQRQRIAIARALAVKPKFIVADEAVSALDVSVQAQVLNLMMELQADLGVSYLFISHDMSVVERISHRVAVMYLGKIVEIGARQEVFENPQHEYTRALLKAVPILDPDINFKDKDVSMRPIPSPIHPVGYEPPVWEYDEVSPGHFVLLNDTDYPI